MTSGEQEGGWRLVIDANILLQAPMRDTLLRLAQERIIAVFWSDTILAEVERNFARVSGTAEAERRYARLIDALRQNFPGAFVPDVEIGVVSPGVAPHDRHVLACALAAPANLIVTYNTRHFPMHLLAPHGVLAWHPDTLLTALLSQRPDDLHEVLLAQGRDLHPLRTLSEILARLSEDAPRFAAQARRRFALE